VSEIPDCGSVSWRSGGIGFGLDRVTSGWVSSASSALPSASRGSFHNISRALTKCGGSRFLLPLESLKETIAF
jgi:hypothetical protein